MPRPRRAFAVGAAGALAALGLLGAGCLLTSDFDNVAGTRPGTTTPEGGGTEGGIDAGEAGASGAPFSCTSAPHILCANFDEGPVDNGGWIIGKNASSSLVLETSVFRSPPASLHSTISAAAKGSGSNATLRQTPIFGVSTKLTYSFDMNVISCMTLGDGGSVTLAAFQPSSVTAFGLVLLDTNEFAFAQLDMRNGGFAGTKFSVAPKLKTWVRIAIHVDTSASAPPERAFVTLDGQRVAEVDQLAAPPSPTMLVNIGANASGPIGGCDVLYDNVTLDKE